MVLLQVRGKPNRRLERKQDIFVRAGPYRISAVRDGWGIPGQGRFYRRRRSAPGIWLHRPAAPVVAPGGPADLGHRPAPDRIRLGVPVLPGSGVAPCASRPVSTGACRRGRGGPGTRAAAAVPAHGRNGARGGQWPERAGLAAWSASGAVSYGWRRGRRRCANLRPGSCWRHKLRSLLRHLRTLLAAAFGAAPPGGPGQCAGIWPCHLQPWQVPYAARPASGKLFTAGASGRT